MKRKEQKKIESAEKIDGKSVEISKTMDNVKKIADKFGEILMEESATNFIAVLSSFEIIIIATKEHRKIVGDSELLLILLDTIDKNVR